MMIKRNVGLVPEREILTKASATNDYFESYAG